MSTTRPVERVGGLGTRDRGGCSETPHTRRRFLALAGLGAGSTLVGSMIWPLDALGATPKVRRNVGGMSAYDPILVSYGKAIRAMQALPDTNPLSWAYQAAIHGTLLSPPQPAWNTCEHGTYFFWSWHRMYLYWFERIIRKMCGDPCWTLPYWAWDLAAERQIPAPFLDSSSILYTTNRNSSMNGGGSLPATDVDYSSAFSQTNFSTASNIFQGTPHAAVHVDVGGWMGGISTAAQDPIFYLHHANCDRLWDLWLAQGSRADPLTDATWKSTAFTFFNEAGAKVTMTGCDVLRAAEQLRYVYEGEPAQVKEYCIRFRPPWIFEQEVVLKLPIPPVALGPEPVSFPIDLNALREKLAAPKQSTAETLFLELDAEAERAPGAVWEVYVGLAANASPDPQGPQYVGNVVLFGEGIRGEAHHHGREFKPAHFLFPLKRALEAVLKSKQDQAAVTFVTRGVLVDGKPTRANVQSPVRIVAAAISVERAKQP